MEVTAADRLPGVNPPARLLAWFDQHRRPLPWRETRDPYRIWVAEVMLQQTRAETVGPYYRRFLQRFPDLEALAGAPVEAVEAAWSGLGYYRRARSLHAAARRLIAAGGRLPRRAAEWERLPGIGPYTAAAIASIAQGEAVPVLDGNVERLLARWTGLETPVGTAAARRRLLAVAASLLEASRPGDGNQALMELGATVCRPQAPRCGECPLAPGCVAAAAGRPEAYPRRRPRRRQERRDGVAAVARDGDRWLLFRRGEGERVLAGRWEVPWVVLDDGDGAPAEEALARHYGGRWRLGERRGLVRHAISYRDYRVEVREVEVAYGDDDGGRGREGRWVRAEDLATLATTSLVAKVVATLEAPPGRDRPGRRRARTSRRPCRPSRAGASPPDGRGS